MKILHFLIPNKRGLNESKEAVDDARKTLKKEQEIFKDLLSKTLQDG